MRESIFNWLVWCVCAESARCSGGRVLVHCQAGVSRSPTIVLAYLMARYNWPMMTAFCYVKSRRHIIAPNFNFMGQLMEFEQRCSSGELRHCLRDDIPPVPISFVAPETSWYESRTIAHRQSLNFQSGKACPRVALSQLPATSTSTPTYFLRRPMWLCWLLPTDLL
jgi:hypothetical protein